MRLLRQPVYSQVAELRDMLRCADRQHLAGTVEALYRHLMRSPNAQDHRLADAVLSGLAEHVAKNKRDQGGPILGVW